MCCRFNKDYTYWDHHGNGITDMVEETMSLGGKMTLEGSPPSGTTNYTRTMLDDILAEMKQRIMTQQDLVFNQKI